MSDTTALEKKSLEAHVDLCAQRYKFLEEKLETIEDRMEQLEKNVETVKDLIQHMSDKQNDRLMQWGMGLIGSLIAVIGWLVINYVMV